MASWNRIRFEDSDGLLPNERPNDKNITMADRTAHIEWNDLIAAYEDRQGFLVQNTSQNEIRIRPKGSNVTGTRLPGYGDSISPDFKPNGAYEVQADEDGSTFVLTVW